jgi:hypothetical protein
MKIGFSTGYREDYWKGWPWVPMMGGSEHIVVQLANQFAKDHEVTVRLPTPRPSWPLSASLVTWNDVRWIGDDAKAEQYDILFAFDDFDVKDKADRIALVACRSDPPPHTHFDQMIFLSAHHAATMGHPGRPHVGGGVNLADYKETKPRLPRRVICCSSPDRCAKAPVIGRGFDFVHSYKPVPGFQTTQFDRAGLIDLQQTAQVMIYPLDPSRPSDFFSMAVLEAMAAGTPVVVSDADSMPELWGGAAIVLPRPIRLSQWHEWTEHLIGDRVGWAIQSDRGRKLAARYDWSLVAQRYLKELA